MAGGGCAGPDAAQGEMAAIARGGRARLHAFPIPADGLCRERRCEDPGARRNALDRAGGPARRGAAQCHAQGRRACRNRQFKRTGKGGTMKRLALAFAVIASLGGANALAQTYPTKPVTVVVTAAA